MVHLWCKYTNNSEYFQAKAGKIFHVRKKHQASLGKSRRKNRNPVIPLFRFVFFCAFLVFFLFEGWFDVVFFLCGFGHAVCYEVNTQTDKAAK